MDAHSLNQISLLHPCARTEVSEAWEKVQQAMPKNINVIIAESYRSFERSDHLYQLGRTLVNPDGCSAEKPLGNIITWAKAGQSWHNWGLAFDISMTCNHKADWTVGPHWLSVVRIMQTYGWEWGGNFPKGKTDNPHFEKKYGQTLSGLMALRRAGKLITGTPYVNFK